MHRVRPTEGTKAVLDCSHAGGGCGLRAETRFCNLPFAAQVLKTAATRYCPSGEDPMLRTCEKWGPPSREMFLPRQRNKSVQKVTFLV